MYSPKSAARKNNLLSIFIWSCTTLCPRSKTQTKVWYDAMSLTAVSSPSTSSSLCGYARLCRAPGSTSLSYSDVIAIQDPRKNYIALSIQLKSHYSLHSLLFIFIQVLLCNFAWVGTLAKSSINIHLC